MKRTILCFSIILAASAAGASYAQDYQPSAACKVIGTCDEGSGGQSSNGPSSGGGSNGFSGNANDQTLQQINKALADLINRLPAAPPEPEPQPAQAAAFTPPDPSQDFSGKPCAFFTKPEVRPDGSGINFYADDSYVKYGANIYHCVDRRWVIGLPESGDARTAEQVEQ